MPIDQETTIDPHLRVDQMHSQPPYSGDDAGRIGLTALRSMLEARPKGVSGPAREGAPSVVGRKEVLTRLDGETRTWAGAEAVTGEVAQMLNKLVDREHIPPEHVEDLSAELALTVGSLAADLEYPTTHQSYHAIARLALSYDLDTARYYVGEDFVAELQDLAEGLPGLEHEIGNYYSLPEIMRRACYTRKPLEDTRLSVHKAVEVCSDKTAYIEKVSGAIANKDLVAALTPNLILSVANRSLQTVDGVFAQTAALYEKYRDQYPFFAANDTRQLVGMLTKSGLGGDRVGLEDKLGHIEAMLERASRDYPGNTQLMVGIARTASNRLSYEDIVARHYRAQATRAVHDERRRGPTEASRRAHILQETSYLEPNDYNALEHGLSYKDMIYEIVTSPELATADKRQLFENIRTVRTSARQFAQRLEPAFGERAKAIYQGIDRRITEIMYTAKYYCEYGDRSEVVPMGSKQVEVSVTPREILRSLDFLQSAMAHLADIKVGESDGTFIEPANLDMGYVDGTNDTVLLLSKAQHGSERTPLIRGRSPRINFVCGMGGIVPSTIAAEREQGCLSIRIDLDGEELVVDIGGKTENPYTPDFAVARCISLGAWLRGKELNQEGQDYHIAIGKMSAEEFAAVAQEIRRSITLSPTPLRVPRVPA